jgi:secreted PhoX family phosphatase
VKKGKKTEKDKGLSNLSIKTGGTIMQEGNISRRNFLKGTAVGAGALAVGASGVSLLTAPRKAHALGYLPTTTLDVDLVRKLAWKHYFTGAG